MKNLLPVILVSFLYACSQSGKTTSGPTDHSQVLYNGKWRISEVAGKSVDPLINNQEPFIQFDTTEKRITGTAGCNRFGGSFEFPSADSVKFSAVYSTKMACENMSVETALFPLFEKAVRYSVIENTVIFLDDSGETLFVLRKG